MKLKQDKFDLTLASHKRTITHLANILKEADDVVETSKEYTWMFMRIQLQARELALARSNFKCEKCQAKNRLSYHHLILQHLKNYMPFDRYVSSRYYWNNILILCWKCHKELHNIKDNGKTDSETEIPEKFKEKVKKKYFE